VIWHKRLDQKIKTALICHLWWRKRNAWNISVRLYARQLWQRSWC